MKNTASKKKTCLGFLLIVFLAYVVCYLLSQTVFHEVYLFEWTAAHYYLCLWVASVTFCFLEMYRAALITTAGNWTGILIGQVLGDFIIKINEFYFPSDKAPVNSTNSYVSMQGNHAVIRMSQDFPSAFSSNRDTESDAVEISDGERKRKGNMQFHMKIKGAEKWQDKELIIILYNNTNQCFVRLHGGYAGVNVINFKGHIYPMAEVIEKNELR